MKTRKHVSLKTKLAAALRCMMVEEGGKFVPALSYEEAKLMDEDAVLSLFHYDHGIHHAIGGEAEHWNLTPRFIAEHRHKTAKMDVPMLAKAVRLSDSHKEFQRKILTKAGIETGQETGQPKRKHQWPTGRKLQGRGFPKRAK